MSHKIRILHLTTDSKIAGAEKLLVGIAKKHDRSKFELFLCVLKSRGDLNTQVETFGVTTFSLGCKSIFDAPGAILRIISLLEEYRIDVLHTHLLDAGVLGNIAGIFSPKTIVIMTRHYSDYLHIFGNCLQRFLDKWALKKAKHIIAISHAAYDAMVDLEKIDSRKISVIHNGIDLEQPEVLAQDLIRKKKELAIAEGTSVIGAIGAIHPRKGHEYLIRAAGILCSKQDNIRFLIVGEGQLKNKLIKLRDSLGLKEKIIFTGYIKDISPILSIMDIFVQPSLEEGFGLTVIEAMRSGKAVIATGVGGIPEIIENQISGLLVPPKDPQALSDTIDSLLKAPDIMQKIGVNAKSRVYEKFGLEAMVRGYEEIYEKL